MTLKNHLIIALTTLLLGCSEPNKISSVPLPLLPLNSPNKIVRMDDGYVKQAIKDFLRHQNAPLFSQYDFTRVDLNNDGLEDAIIYINTPYGYWCNDNGCTVLIMKAHNKGFSVVGNIKSVRKPFSVEISKTNGWNDIKIYISGKKEEAYTTALSFNGNKYTMDLDNKQFGSLY